MFEDSLFDTTARPERRRGVAALISFAFQAIVLTVLVLLPMVFTNALPVNALKGLVFVPTAPTRARAPKAPEPRHTRQAASNFENSQLIQPISIPLNTKRIVDTQSPDPGGDPGADVFGAISLESGGQNRAMAALLNGLPKPEQPHNIVPPRAVRLSGGVVEGLLIHKIMPDYPSLARQARIQGSVILQATISPNGTIENMQAVSGHPWLIRAAMDAVKQWRYRPYLLNNEPVEVETRITVNFTLGG